MNKKTVKPRHQPIRTKLDYQSNSNLHIGGWLAGRNTYLRFAVGDTFMGTIGEYKLYRLAKAIVRRYEAKQ